MSFDVHLCELFRLTDKWSLKEKHYKSRKQKLPNREETFNTQGNGKKKRGGSWHRIRWRLQIQLCFHKTARQTVESNKSSNNITLEQLEIRVSEEEDPEAGGTPCFPQAYQTRLFKGQCKDGGKR